MGGQLATEIGFVIYVKNAVRTIGRALDSVLAQNGVAFELVVIDGASTDGTTDVIRSYERHLSYFESRPDRGAFEAANRGWRAVTTPVVWFVMADDWIEPDAGAAAVAALRTHPEAGIASMGVRIVDEGPDGTFTVALERSGHENAFGLDAILGTPFSAARAWRHETLAAFDGFDAAYPNAHDRDLMMRAWLGGVRDVTVEAVCYTYRRHPGSNTLGGNAGIVAAFLDEHRTMSRRWLAMPALLPETRQRIETWRRAQLAESVLLDLRLGRFGHAGTTLLSEPSAGPATVTRVAELVSRCQSRQKS